MAQGYGLDPYAAPIVGAANTIMQGAQAMQQMKDREADREWTQEQRQRQRQEWEEADQAQELYSMLIGGGQTPGSGNQPAPGSDSGTGQSAQSRQAPPGRPPSPEGQASSRQQQQQGLSPQAAGMGLSVPGQQDGGTQDGDARASEDPDYSILDQAAPNLEQINERMQHLDLDKYDPGAVRKARALAIQDSIDQIQFSTANMKNQQAKWEQERQRLYPQAMQALQGYASGDRDSVDQLISVANELPNGLKFDTDGENLLVWDVADERTPENADKMPLSEISVKQAQDFIMPALDPQSYHNQMLADLKAAKEHNREEMTNPYVLQDKETGQRLYMARTIDRRSGNKLAPTFAADPFFSEPFMADSSQLDMSRFKVIGRAEDLESGGAPDVVDLGALGKGVWDPESGQYQPIKGSAKQGSGPEVKDYIYDTQDGRPATRGYITKQGSRVLFDQPVPGYLGETPKSVDPTEAKKAALDVDNKKQQKHDKSLEKALMPFKSGGGQAVKFTKEGGFSLTDSGSEAFTKAFKTAETARQKAEDERTWKEQKAIEAMDLYDIIMEDTQDQYGMNMGLSSPQNLGFRLPPPTLNPDSGSRPGSDLRFSTQGYNMPSLGLQYQTVPQGDSWRNWVR